TASRKKIGVVTTRRLSIAAGLIAAALPAIGLALFLGFGAPSKTTTDSVQLQDITSDELKQFTNAFLKPTTNQVVTITPNAHFNNAVTVEKTLSAGAISTPNLNVTGPVNLDSVNINSNVFVNGGTTLQGVVEARNQVNVRGSLTAANASFSGNLAVAGTLTAGALSVGELTTGNLIANGNLTVNGHLSLMGGAVTATAGPGAGGGSVQVFGNDVTGTVVITVGGGPVAGQMAIINFKKAYSGVPHVLLTPIGQNAGSLQWYATRAASFFSIDTASAPAAGTEYAFDYFVQK
ncbi:MAG TPA: hypothetical protein VF272_00755, partial [Candidatus Saccharimonadia bacterium]